MIGAKEKGYNAYVNWLFKRIEGKPVNPYPAFSVRQMQWQRGWKDAFTRYAFYR